MHNYHETSSLVAPNILKNNTLNDHRRRGWLLLAVIMFCGIFIMLGHLSDEYQLELSTYSSERNRKGSLLPLDAVPQDINGVYSLVVNSAHIKYAGGGVDMDLRVYNGKFGGGLITADTSRDLLIRLENKLEREGPHYEIESRPFNSYRLPNETNLHTHGLHVSPSAPSDDVFSILKGGEHKTYAYKLGADHPAGLYWYHPHAHGATALQQSSGMFGPLLVENPDFNEESLGLLPPLASDSVIVLSVLSAAGIVKVAKMAGSLLSEKTANDAGFLALVNGEVRPTSAAAQSGQSHRLRLVNAAVKEIFLLSADVSTTGPLGGSCVFFLTASDGTAQRHPRSLSLTPERPLIMAPGNRRDIVFECITNGSTSVSVEWRSVPRPPAGSADAPNIPWEGLTSDVYKGGPLFTTPIAAATTSNHEDESGNREARLSAWLASHPDWSSALSPRLFPASPLAAPTSPASTFHFTFNEGGAIVRGSETMKMYGVNGNPLSMDPRSARKVPLHSTEEWIVANDHATSAHPFHLHTNHFQVVASSRPAGDDFIPTDWRDTIVIAPLSNVTIRWRANDYMGMLLAHCHVTTHSDAGMGMMVNIVEPMESLAEPKRSLRQERGT